MKNILNRSKANQRAKKISEMARGAFNSAVYGCQIVSHYNTGLSFIVNRVGAFGFPSIEVIDRPGDVVIAESDDCVIVRDGYYFELDKRK